MHRTLFARTWDALVARKTAPCERRIRGTGLSVTHLEDRITPTGPTFDYTFTEMALGSIVTVIGLNGQSVTAVADHLDSTGKNALATVNAPDPAGVGVNGQSYWNVEVEVANGWRATSVLAPVWNLDGSVYNAQTFCDRISPDGLAELKECPPLLPGLGGATAAGNDSHQTTADTVSEAGVDYATGRVRYSATDVGPNGLADPFGQSRDWAGDTGNAYGQRLGNGWANPNLPTAQLLGLGNLWFVSAGDSARMFKKVGSDWVPTLGGQSRLTVDATAGEVTMTDETGATTTFYAAASGVSPPERVGQMKRSVDVAGVATAVVSWASNGAPAEVRRTVGGTTESWVYSYGTSAVTANLTTSVVSRRSLDGGTTWQGVQAVEYGYYGAGNANGNLNDLRAVTTRVGGLTGTVVNTSYYRYYRPNDPVGYQGQLKAVVAGASFDRLAVAYAVTLATADTLTDAQLAVYADRVYTYDVSLSATKGRVTSVLAQGNGCSACSGGQGLYTYGYGRNPRYASINPTESPEVAQNGWEWATLETLPDGNSNRVYTNASGQAMLRVYTETSTGQQTEAYTEFDALGRVRRVADAVAVTGWDDQYDDLLHGVLGNYQFLADASGAVTEYVYSLATTATATTAGEVAGYLRRTQVRQGEMALLAVPLSGQTYFARTGAGSTIYPIAATTIYPIDRSTVPLAADDFSGGSLGAGWTLAGSGTWVQSGGVLTQTDNATGLSSGGVFKQAHLTGQAWNSDQEIVASIRVDSWSVGSFGEWASAGVGVRGNAANGYGYCLVFREAGYVRFQDNFHNLGPQVAFTWSLGTWYRMRVRIEDNVLYGKVWAAADPEPVGWMLALDVAAAGWTSLPTGNPHLFGGMSAGTPEHMSASFDGVYVPDIALPPGETTSYAYTWSAVSPLLTASVTVTAPTVSVAQNGSGTPDSSVTSYDDSGRPVWTKDAAGFIRYTAYDPVTGTVVRTIIDVNTSLTGDFSGLPAGWTTPTGGGAHLKTDRTVDSIGRVTKTVSPAGSIDYSTYDDASESAKTYTGWTGSTTTGPVKLVRRDRVGGDVTVGAATIRYTYVETLTYAPSSIPVDGSSRPTGAEAVSNIQSLSREFFNQSGQLVWRDQYFDLTGLSYLDGSGKPVFALGTEGANFLRTRYGYDKRGRLSRAQTPDGVITRTVLDGQGRTASTWRGTNDTPTSGYWSPTNPAGMVQTAAYEYDNGTAGDGNLTKVTLKPGGGSADRVTAMAYDWRNRLVVTKEGVEATESEAVNRPVTYFDVDNLGRAIRTRVYDGDTVAFADADGNGVPDAPAAARLRSQTDTAYDSQGRVYRTTTAAVNQATEAVSATQWVTDAWYDARGLAGKTRAADGLVTKTAYDGVGRTLAMYSSDGGGDSSWADAFNVAGDTVLAQQELAYDGESHVVRTTRRDRVDGQTGTGALGTPTTGVLARVTDSGFYYDAAGRLTATVDVGTNGGTAWTRPGTVPTRTDTELVTSVGYGANGLSLDVTDPRGITTRTATDLLGRTVSVTNAYGTGDAFTTASKYDAAGRPRLVTAPGGRTTKYAYDSLGRVGSVIERVGTAFQRTTAYEYDNLDAVVRMTDAAGMTTGYARDVVGRSVSVTQAAGTPLDRTATTAFDALGRTVSVTDPRGNATGYAYDDPAIAVTRTDAVGYAWVTSYDKAGRVTGQADPYGKTTVTAYDLLGRVVSVTDPLGHARTFQYMVNGSENRVTDALSNTTKTAYDRLGRVASTSDALGNTVGYAYDRNGNVVTATDAKGVATAFTYDNLDRTITVTAAVGKAEQRATTSAYNSSGDLVTVTDAIGRVTRYGYDAAGRQVSRTAADGTADAFTVRTAYDLLDRVVSVTVPGSRTTGSVYDLLGRLTKTTESVDSALERVTAYTYDANGNRLTVTDPLGRVTATAYDKLNRATTTTDAQSGVVTVAYDKAGRQVSLTDPTGNVTQWGYDDAGRKTSETDPLGKATGYAYDAADRLVTVTDRTGRTRTYGYDAAGRTTSDMWKSSGGSTIQTNTYTYDANGNQLTANNSNANYTLGYDNLNRVVSVSGPFGVTQAFAYDAADNRLTATDNQGGATTSTYDNLNRLSSRILAVSGTNAVKAVWTYTAASDADTQSRSAWVSGAWSAAGSTVTTTDPLARTTALVHKNAAGATVGGSSYAYDSGDRITSQTINGTTQTFGYDGLDQVTNNNGATVSYDKSGNRTTSGYVVGAGNRVTSDGVWSYTYDNNGAVIGKSKSGEAWAYTYDLNGQMTSASKSATVGGTVTDSVAYAYDAWGNRVSRVQTGTTSSTERYVVDGWDTAKGKAAGTENFDTTIDLNSSNAVTARRVFGAGFDNAVARRDSSGAVTWYGADALGSVRQVFDNSGAVTGSRVFDGFGVVTVTSGTGLDRYAYTGTVTDPLTGLVGDNARVYDPTTGRWLSPDPSGFAAGDANLYRYLGNSPTGLTDPSGLVEKDFFGRTTVLGYDNPGIRINGIGRIINGVEIAGIGGPVGAIYGLDVALHGALDLLTGEYHPTFTAQALDALTGTNCASKYEEMFDQAYSLIRGVQMAPQLIKAVAKGGWNVARGVWSATGWTAGKLAVATGTRDTLYGFKGLGEGFNSSLRNWLKACFAAGTPIRTPDGSKLIEDIVAGDWVLSRDEFDAEGPVVPRRVEEVFVRNGLIWEIRLDGQVIRSTAEHPFFRQSDGWVPLNQVRVGDRLLSEGGEWLVVEGIRDTGDFAPVYNFRVAEDHTYFVGCDEWGFAVWAHNNTACFGAIDDLIVGGRSATNTLKINALTAKEIKVALDNIFGRTSSLAGPREATSGVIYVLRDAVTGEVFKVGKTTTSLAAGRFKSYKDGIGSLEKRGASVELVVDFVRLKASGKDATGIRQAEETLRASYGGDIHGQLLWDNTVLRGIGTRLGFSGQGVPWKNPVSFANWQQRQSSWFFTDGAGI